MSRPVSNIIVTLILTLGFLFGVGAFSAKNDYATVSFDGGWQKLGVISTERIFTKVRISFEDRDLVSGDIDKAIEWIQKDSLSKSDNPSTVTWRAGVAITASAGVEWIASVIDFQLTIASINKQSTNGKFLYPVEIIEELRALKQKAKDERVKTATESLRFSPAPQASLFDLMGRTLGK